MNILIVEDARDQRLMLSVVLKKKGHQVLEAEDGLQALEVLKTHPEVRIVISDWMMPEMDGIELCQAIREHDFGHYLYFILLTGKTENQAVVEGINKGADDFLSKPVNFDELEARLKAGIRIIELERALEEKNKALSSAIATIEKDLESAARTQAGLLAKPATIKDVEFNWFFKPSKHLGGDMFGYQALDDDHIYFYQLDVAGHGIPSALFSFTLNNILSDTGRGSLHKKKIEGSSELQLAKPEQVLASLNDRFQATAENMLYFTIAYGILNNKTGEVVLSQAGHPNPLWVKRNLKVVEPVQGVGVPIGMMPGQEYSSVKFQLSKEDRLFLYSDGLTECDDGTGEQFGEDRLANTLADTFDDSIETMIGRVEEKIKVWNKKDVFEDDVTYLILEWNPQS